jgi:hypothetical protein
MNANKELLAYCGLYCGDCLGHTGVIAEATAALKAVLDRYRFERTAKAVFPGQLADYDKLYRALEFMTTLRCPAICRQATREGDTSSCEVKNCCLDKGFYACYECDDYETCEALLSLHGGLHADSCLKNLQAIRDAGLEAWLAAGPRHCYWLEQDR